MYLVQAGPNFIYKLLKIRNFFVRRIVEFGLFQASEHELGDRIAILTRTSRVEVALKRVIFRNSAASAREIRVNIAILRVRIQRLEIDQIRLFFEQKKFRIFSNLLTKLKQVKGHF